MSLMAGETMARFSGRIFEYSAQFYSSPLAIFSVGDEELAYESMLKCNSKKAKGSFPGISDKVASKEYQNVQAPGTYWYA